MVSAGLACSVSGRQRDDSGTADRCCGIDYFCAVVDLWLNPEHDAEVPKMGDVAHN
jgi:hypothetical protein